MEILFIVAAVAASAFGAYRLTPKQQSDRMRGLKTPHFFMDIKIIEEIQQWEKEYPTMEGVTLNKREKELLDGAEIKSHEGMVFGRMYADWKLRKGYE